MVLHVPAEFRRYEICNALFVQFQQSIKCYSSCCMVFALGLSGIQIIRRIWTKNLNQKFWNEEIAKLKLCSKLY